jgi:hypothetical protein
MVKEDRTSRKEIDTFGTEVCSSNIFGDAIKPARFYAFETAVPLDKIFSAEVNRTIVVSEDDASATTDDQGAYEKRKEKEEKGGKDY